MNESVGGVGGWVSVWGLLIDNLTPHKDSNSLSACGYATVPLLPQHFVTKFTWLSRLLLNPCSDPC